MRLTLTNPFSIFVLCPPLATFPAAAYLVATLSTANSLTGGVELQEAVPQLRTTAKATKAKAIFAPPMIEQERLKFCLLDQGPFYMEPYQTVTGLLKPYQRGSFFASHL